MRKSKITIIFWLAAWPSPLLSLSRLICVSVPPLSRSFSYQKTKSTLSFSFSFALSLLYYAHFTLLNHIYIYPDSGCTWHFCTLQLQSPFQSQNVAHGHVHCEMTHGKIVQTRATCMAFSPWHSRKVAWQSYLLLQTDHRGPFFLQQSWGVLLWSWIKVLVPGLVPECLERLCESVGAQVVQNGLVPKIIKSSTNVESQSYNKRMMKLPRQSMWFACGINAIWIPKPLTAHRAASRLGRSWTWYLGGWEKGGREGSDVVVLRNKAPGYWYEGKDPVLAVLAVAQGMVQYFLSVAWCDPLAFFGESLDCFRLMRTVFLGPVLLTLWG
jgi:hypothetical protein